MRRLCIYLVYDQENIVDNYISYMLKELKTCCEYLLVVYNSKIIKEGEQNLTAYADEIICRDNIGYDAGGFKDALCKYIGWNEIMEYDELVLANDSFFGPFRRMDSIFSDMANRVCDFWGLTKHAYKKADNIVVPEHVQSYFIVVRKRMFSSMEYRFYWDSMPYYDKFWDVVIQHEEKFTSFFSNLGYTYEVLADTEINDSQINLANNYSQYATISYELIKKRNFPFLKKQQIAYNTLTQQTQENLYQAICYIDEETDYDVDLIWENIIRTLNMADLQRSLHLQYIISSDEKKFEIKNNIAIVVFVKYRRAAEYILEYLNILKNAVDYCIHVISDDDDILKEYRANFKNRKKILLKKNCDWNELCKYDFVCVLHDEDVSSDVNPSCTGKSYLYSIWENLFKNTNHILGILEKFEKEERLGFLAPPQPNFANYFGNMGKGWNGNYEVVKTIIKRLQLHSPISEEKPPFRITDNFWIRGNILQCIEELKTEEFSYLPYLWSYFAQHLGYYSGIVESTDYASMNEVNMQYCLEQIVTQIKSECGNFSIFNEMQEILLFLSLKKYCEEHAKILVYGTGYYAQRYKNCLKNVEGYVVSDGREKMDCFNGFPVKYLSEFGNLDGYGLVLCLDKKNQVQIIPILEKRGITDYFCVY